MLYRISIIAFLILSIEGFNHTQFCQSYDAIVRESKTEYTINKSKLIEYNSIDILINNRRGEKYTAFSVNYSRSNKLKKLDGWIEDLTGNIIRKIDKKEIITSSAISDISLYEDDYKKSFTLKHNVYPYVVHCEYTIEYEQFMEIANWSPVYKREIPTLKAELSLDLPKDFEIKTSESKIDKPAITEVEDRKIIVWKSDYPEPLEEEVYSPPFSLIIPHVEVIPVKFTYGVSGSFESWQTFGEWSSSLMVGLQELPLSEKMNIDKLLETAKNDYERISILYHYLQKNTRYINVSINIGGIKPYPASYVVSNKYGDCKALTNYMLAMLTYKNIPAYYTKVYAGDDILTLDPRFPCPDFNHIILFIPLQNDTVWLDCTNNYAPVGYLGTFTQNRDVLIVDSNKSKIIKTPALSESDVCSISKFDITLNPLSGTTIIVNRDLKGSSYESMETFSKLVDKKEQERIIRESIDIPEFELINWKINKKNIDSTGISFSYSITSNSLIKKYGDESVIKSFTNYLPDFEPIAKRKLDVEIDYPTCRIDTFIYRLPSSYTISAIPEKENITTEFGSYSLSVIQNPNEFTVIRKFVLKSGKYPVSRYPEFYSFIQEIKKADKQNNLIFK